MSRISNKCGIRFRSQARRGVAVVEFAVCVPVLVVIVFGSIEICNAIYLKQAATASAYEAVRVATGTGGTMNAGQVRGEEILASRSISGGTIVFDPAAETSWNRGDRISVIVTVPVAENMSGINLFFPAPTLEASVVMAKQ